MKIQIDPSLIKRLVNLQSVDELIEVINRYESDREKIHGKRSPTVWEEAIYPDADSQTQTEEKIIRKNLNIQL